MLLSSRAKPATAQRSVFFGRCSMPTSNDEARSGAIVPGALAFRNSSSGNCDAAFAPARNVKPRTVRSPSNHGDTAVHDPAEALDVRIPAASALEAVGRASGPQPLTTVFGARKAC